VKTDDVMREQGASAAVHRLRAAPPIDGDESDDVALFDTPTLPEFPADVFPAWIRNMVKAVSRETETPVDLAAMLGLAVLSTACSRHIVVAPRRTKYVEPLNTYSITVLPSGARKTPVFNAMSAPVMAYERELAKEGAGRLAVEQAKWASKENRLESLRKDLQKAEEGGDSTAAVELQIEDLARRLDEKPPVAPRLLVSDVTTEKLSMLLYEHGRIAVLDDEGGLFETMAGRYSRNGAPNIDPYLKGFNGSPLTVDRVARGSYVVDRPHLTIGMTVQPDVLRSMGNKQGFRGRGLTGRFLYSIPKSTVGNRTFTTPPAPEDVVKQYTTALRYLLAIPDPGPEPYRIEFAPDASAAFLEFCLRIEPRRGAQGDLGNIPDWASKLDGAVARIAGLLHVAELGPEAWKTEIPVEIVQRAIRAGDYFIEHAKAAYGELGSDPVSEAAQRVVEWIRARKLTTLTLRDLLRGKAAGIEDKRELEPVIATLVERGILIPVEQKPTGKPGRPASAKYLVAAQVLDQNGGAR
jgi:replicative DNA helicase